MNIEIYEASGLPTTTRVFAALVSNQAIGFLTVDAERETVELVFVYEAFRRQGIATRLLEAARAATGLALDKDTGDRTLDGSRWAKSVGLRTGGKYRRIADRDLGGGVAQMMFSLPSAELTPVELVEA